MKYTEIFAHRGASQYAPENTLEAFDLAMRQGADGIELDVQLTREGKAVVIHDEEISRVSTGEGYVREYTLKELRQFSFHNHMGKYEGVKIPTLEEVLSLVKRGNMKVNIELKTGIYWYPHIEEKVLEAVRDAKMQERVIYSSFNHYSIQRICELDAHAETAYLFSDVILDVEKYALKNKVSGLHPALYHVEMDGFLESYLKSGLAVRVWTVNEKEQMEKLFRANVDALITNRPDVAVSIRKQRMGQEIC